MQLWNHNFSNFLLIFTLNFTLISSFSIQNGGRNNFLKIEDEKNIAKLYSHTKTSDDFTGNLTQTQLTAIKKYISQAQNKFEIGQLNQMARYISDGLQELSKIRYWTVFVYDNQTKGAGYQGVQILNKYLWWIKYGKYQLTYIMADFQECYGTGTAGALAVFGEDVSSADQDFIKQIVKNSQLYKGEDCQQGAIYLRTKMEQKKRGWIFNVYVTKPATKYGFYECRRKQYWAQLQNFGTLGLTYHIVRFM